MNNNFVLKEHVDSSFANHVMVESPCKSYRFYGHATERSYDPATQAEMVRFLRSSAYSFQITWKPGSIFLSGDLGDITLTHGHSMNTFDEALDWVIGSEFDYLMGKSGVAQTYDAEATYLHLIEHANQRVINDLMGTKTWNVKKQKYVLANGERQQLQRARREIAEAHAEFQADMEKHASAPDDGPMPELKDYLPTPDYPYTISRVEYEKSFSIAETAHEKIREAWDIPDGWLIWVSFWTALFADKYYRPDLHVDDEEQHPTFVLKPANRREIKDRIRELCANQHELCEFLYEAGYEDYSGSYTYPGSSRWKIDALKHGCKMLKENRS